MLEIWRSNRRARNHDNEDSRALACIRPPARSRSRARATKPICSVYQFALPLPPPPPCRAARKTAASSTAAVAAAPADQPRQHLTTPAAAQRQSRPAAAAAAAAKDERSSRSRPSLARLFAARRRARSPSSFVARLRYRYRLTSSHTSARARAWTSSKRKTRA